jgi:hypothetical protein
MQERLPTAAARRSRRVVLCSTFGADHAADLVAYGRNVRQHASAALADWRSEDEAAPAPRALSESRITRHSTSTSPHTDSYGWPITAIRTWVALLWGDGFYQPMEAKLGKVEWAQESRTFSPLGPFGPCPTSKVTVCPS